MDIFQFYTFSLFTLQGNETTSGGTNNRLCADNIRIPVGSSTTYVCRSKVYGRYLYIRIPGSNKILTLCEVEVYSLTFSPVYFEGMHDVCVCIFFSPFTKQVICFENTCHDHLFILHCRHTTCMYSCTCTLNINKLIQKCLQYLIFRCLRLYSKKTSKVPNALQL